MTTIRDQSLIDNITATEIEDGTEPVRWSFPKASPVAEMFPFLAWRDEDADSISIEADEGELMVLHVAALSHVGIPITGQSRVADSARDCVSVEGLRHVRRAIMGGLDCEPLVDWADLNARMAVFEVDNPEVMADLVLEEQDLQQHVVVACDVFVYLALFWPSFPRPLTLL